MDWTDAINQSQAALRKAELDNVKLQILAVLKRSAAENSARLLTIEDILKQVNAREADVRSSLVALQKKFLVRHLYLPGGKALYGHNYWRSPVV